MNKGIGVFIFLSLFVLCLYGCASSKKSTGKITFTEVQENLRFDNTDLKRQVFDMNHDGRIDMWKYYRLKAAFSDKTESEYTLLRKELDLNFDGRIDRIMYYDSKENLSREEIDVDFDGRIDRISFYDNGFIVKTEIYSGECKQAFIDKASDGANVYPYATRHYRKGVFTREERDDGCRGQMSSVLIFNEKSEVSQIGYDRDGDGIIEEWVRY